jgi:hypothetical protein
VRGLCGGDRFLGALHVTFRSHGDGIRGREGSFSRSHRCLRLTLALGGFARALRFLTLAVGFNLSLFRGRVRACRLTTRSWRVDA